MAALSEERAVWVLFGLPSLVPEASCIFHTQSFPQDQRNAGAEGETLRFQSDHSRMLVDPAHPAFEQHSGFLKNWREHASLAGEVRERAGASFGLVFILKQCKCLKYDM